MLTLALGGAIAFLAALTQATTGFGFALVLVPLLSLIYEPKLVVVISLTLGLASRLPLLVQTWRKVEPFRIAPLCVAAVVGTTLGAYILLITSGPVLQLAIGLIVAVLSSAMLVERYYPVRHESMAMLVVGFVSGVLTGSTSMGGPPVVLFGVNQSWEKSAFRANLVAFFLVSNISAILSLWVAGALTWEALRLDGLFLPGVLLGVAVGSAVFNRLPHNRFRRLVVLLVIASGVVSAWTGAARLIG